MKKTLLFVSMLLCLARTGLAQTQKGDGLVGGNLELNTAKNNSTINISPMAGYFFADNFAAGANLDINYQKQGELKLTSFGIGPFARYYFLGNATLRPLVHADLNFTSNKRKIGSESSTLTGTNYFLGGGAAAFLNRNVALEALAGYDHTAFENQDGTGGFKIKVGFQVYLSRAQVAAVTR